MGISREEILKIHTRNMPLGKDVDIKHFATITEGYSGADMESLVREAAMLALRRDIDAKTVTKKHFDEALGKVRASISKKTIDTYKKIEQNYLKSAKAAIEQTAGTSYLG